MTKQTCFIILFLLFAVDSFAQKGVITLSPSQARTYQLTWNQVAENLEEANSFVYSFSDNSGSFVNVRSICFGNQSPFQCYTEHLPVLVNGSHAIKVTASRNLLWYNGKYLTSQVSSPGLYKITGNK